MTRTAPAEIGRGCRFERVGRLPIDASPRALTHSSDGLISHSHRATPGDFSDARTENREPSYTRTRMHDQRSRSTDRRGVWIGKGDELVATSRRRAHARREVPPGNQLRWLARRCASPRMFQTPCNPAGLSDSRSLRASWANACSCRTNRPITAESSGDALSASARYFTL